MKLIQTYGNHDIYEVEIRGRTYYKCGDLNYSNLEVLKQTLNKTGSKQNYTTTEASLPSVFHVAIVGE